MRAHRRVTPVLFIALCCTGISLVTSATGSDSSSEGDIKSPHHPSFARQGRDHGWGNASMALFLEASRHRWHDTLLSPEAYELLQTSMSQLPGLNTAGVIFEARLDDDPQVDFSTSSLVHEKSRYKKSMLNALLSEPLDPRLQKLVDRSPVWQRLQAFARYVKASDASVWGDFWLEFDVSRDSVETPAPSIFLSPETMSYEDMSQQDWAKHVDEHFMGEFATAFEILTGGPLPQSHIEPLRSAIHALPDGGELHQVGFWLTRKADFVRLIVILPEKKCLSNVKTVSKYLTTINYPAERGPVRELLKNACKHIDRVVLAVDVGEKTYPKLGFESYVEEAEETEGKKKIWIWRRYLNYLEWVCEYGLGNKEKVEALRYWTGYTVDPEERDKGGWSMTLYERPGLFKFVRLINHIKLVYIPNEPLKAKMYLWVTRGDWGTEMANYLDELKERREKDVIGSVGTMGDQEPIEHDIDDDDDSNVKTEL